MDLLMAAYLHRLPSSAAIFHGQTCPLALRFSSQEWQNVSRPTPPGPKGSNGNLTAVVAASGFFIDASHPVT